MFNVEKICINITEFICKDLNFNNEKKAVVNYGVFAFLQMGISILLVIIFGIIFNMLIEALIISFVISILRKSSGGVHADSPEKCAIVGTILSLLGAYLSKVIIISNYLYIILLGMIVFGWAYIIINKYAPVDSVSKPIKSDEKRNRLKKNSISILYTYIVLVILGLFIFKLTLEYKYLIYILCIYIGVIWQTFSLTNTGKAILSKI